MAGSQLAAAAVAAILANAIDDRTVIDAAPVAARGCACRPAEWAARRIEPAPRAVSRQNA
jgi:hypothetical protein